MSEIKYPFSAIRRVWMNGRMIDFADAKVSVLAHGLHYGSGAFEGIRAYETPAGPAVFRLRAHIRRLETSAKLYRMDLPYSTEELEAAVLEVLRENELGAAYVRPLVFRGFATLLMNPRECPVEVAIAAWPSRARVLGAAPAGEGDEGVEVGVSSWRRPAADALPAIAKTTGHYALAQLVTMEALAAGYQEAIVLDHQGNVGEGAVENLFLVKDGELVTPPLAASILGGITRDCILVLARELGIPVVERSIPRSLLYDADEMFFTGTSAEVTPIRSVDRIAVGDGSCPGPVTARLSERYLALARGEAEDVYGWRTPVHGE